MVPKISKNLVAYLAGLIVVTQYAAGSAAGLAEAHADVALKHLKLVSDTEYTSYLQPKLVEWYAAAPKSDCRASAGEEADEEAPEAREGGVAEEDRQIYWTSSGSIRTGEHLNTIEAAFQPSRGSI